MPTFLVQCLFTLLFYDALNDFKIQEETYQLNIAFIKFALNKNCFGTSPFFLTTVPPPHRTVDAQKPMDEFFESQTIDISFKQTDE
jgi:hypothetical protein